MVLAQKMDGTDVLFYESTTGVDQFRWRGGGAGVIFYDNIPIVFGSNADASILYDETTHDRLEITCAAIDLDGNVTLAHTDHTLTLAALAASADGSGVAISSSRTQALVAFGDTGSAALTAGTYRTGRARMLVGTAPGAAAIHVFGMEAELKATANVNAATGDLAGLKASFESITGVTVGDHTSALVAQIDAPTGATIAAGAVLSAIHVTDGDLGGTHTGDAAVFDFEAPSAGAYDYWAVFEASCGMTTQAGGSLTITDKILVKSTGGNDRFIAVGTIA